MLIELMGPSGVGKSTVLNVLEKNEPSVKTMRKRSEGLNVQDLRFYCDFFNIDNFLNGVIEILSLSSLPPTKKMAAINMVNETAINFAKRCVNKRSHDSNIIEIEDELFLHRSYAILLYSNNFINDVTWYFQSVPIPDAVVIFHAESSTLLKRIRERGKVINTYLYLNDEDILFRVKRSVKMYEIATCELERRNVKVFHINAENKVSKAAKDMAEIINSLGERCE